MLRPIFTKVADAVANEQARISGLNKADAATAKLTDMAPLEYLATGAGAIGGGVGGYYLSKAIHRNPSGVSKLLYSLGGSVLGGVGANALLRNLTDSEGRTLSRAIRENHFMATDEAIQKRNSALFARIEEYNSTKNKTNRAVEKLMGTADEVAGGVDLPITEIGARSLVSAAPYLAGKKIDSIRGDLEARTKGVNLIRKKVRDPKTGKPIITKAELPTYKGVFFGEPLIAPSHYKSKALAPLNWVTDKMSGVGQRGYADTIANINSIHKATYPEAPKVKPKKAFSRAGAVFSGLTVLHQISSALQNRNNKAKELLSGAE